MKRNCGTVICLFALSKSLRHTEVGATWSDVWDLNQQPTSLGYVNVEKGFYDVFLEKQDDVSSFIKHVHTKTNHSQFL
jgi:hypothetical protein